MFILHLQTSKKIVQMTLIQNTIAT